MVSFCLEVLSSGKSGVLKHPTIISVCDTMYDLNYSNVCFMNASVFLFGVQNWEFILGDFYCDEYEMTFHISFD